MPLIKYWRPDGFDPVDLSIPEHHKKKKFLRPTRKWTVTRDFGDDIPDLHDDGGGIGILAYNEAWVGMPNFDGDGTLDVPRDFAAYTVMCLRLLYETRVGATVLDFLGSRGTLIQSDPGGNAVQSTPSMTSVATELAHDVAPNVKLQATSQAVSRMLVAGGAERYAYLAQRINSMQRLHLDAQDGAPPMNMNLTRKEVFDWIDKGKVINRLTGDQKVQLRLATIAVLENAATRGVSGQASIKFCTKRDTFMNTNRPPAIGLGHELIHAYFHAQGTQPGLNFGAPSTALYEFKCIGIGPWAQAAISENALRTQWAAIRVNWANNVDDLHDRAPPRRIMYM